MDRGARRLWWEMIAGTRPLGTGSSVNAASSTSIAGESAPRVRYRCVSCGSTLRTSTAGVDCPSCGCRYPVLAGRLPVLVENADLYLARSLLDLHHAARDLRARGSRTPAECLALESEAAHADALARMIRPHVTPDTLARAIDAPRPTSGPWSGAVGLRAARGYLRRDWSGLPKCEEEVAATNVAVHDLVEQHCGDREAALIIGSGLGRYAWDLRDHFAEVHAIDASFAMMATLQLLDDGPLDVRAMNEHVLTADDELETFRASLRQHDGAAGSFHHAISDAAALPYAMESFSCVVSVYFTSIPSPILVSHVLRVLKVGGVFIHFGPPTTSVDELRASLVAGGFDLESEGVVDNTLSVSDRVLHRTVWRNWSASARKARAASVDPATVLAITRDLGFEVTCTVSNESLQNHFAVITHPAIGTVRVQEPLLSFLTLVDGIRTVGSILAELQDHGLPASERRRVLEAPDLAHLINAGVLRVEAAGR